MNLFFFALWQLMIIVVIGERIAPADRNKLVLEVEFPGHVATVTLWRVNRALANKFLPVWITTNKSRKEFKKLNIIKQIGEFTMFQDTCTKSAAIYFHKRREIVGVFAVSYYFTGFHIDEKKVVHRMYSFFLLKVPDFESGMDRLSRSIDNRMLIRTRRNRNVHTFYPELLIAISHGTYEALERTSKLPRNVAIISHILVVYNAADLLFRLIRTLDIQLNIAGILIEGIPKQWNFESESVIECDSKTGSICSLRVNAVSIHPKLEKYLWHRQNNFPRHSYDIILYHTIADLRNSEGSKINGQSSFFEPGGFMFPNDVMKERLSVIVKKTVTFKYFTTIAHEISHILSAKHDGQGPLGHMFDMKTCGGSIMGSRGTCSDSCLKWSPQAYQELEDFFSTQPIRCDLMNYPRSLDVPKPKMIFSAEAQCQCYGYESYFHDLENKPKEKCRKPLICISKFRRLVKTSLPMDGTPCDPQTVCWNNECVPFEN